MVIITDGSLIHVGSLATMAWCSPDATNVPLRSIVGGDDGSNPADCCHTHTHSHLKIEIAIERHKIKYEYIHIHKWPLF